MTNFTDRLRDYGLTDHEHEIICDRRVVDEAADMIDEMERALRESQAVVLAFAAIYDWSKTAKEIKSSNESLLAKLERL